MEDILVQINYFVYFLGIYTTSCITVKDTAESVIEIQPVDKEHTLADWHQDRQSESPLTAVTQSRQSRSGFSHKGLRPDSKCAPLHWQTRQQLEEENQFLTPCLSQCKQQLKQAIVEPAILQSLQSPSVKQQVHQFSLVTTQLPCQEESTTKL